MKKVLLAGGTGFIGIYLSDYLVKQGYEISILTRRKIATNPNIKYYQWDVEKGIIDKNSFDSIDTVINLTGANIGAKRWSKKRKQEIISSRVDSTNLLFQCIFQNNFPIKRFITASAVGYYGAVTADGVFTEESPNGSDFLAAVCQQWEAAAQQFAELDCRVIILRQGVVLGKDGGIYGKLAPLAKWGINTAVGSGKQYIPWIDIRDLCRLYLFLLENAELKGAFNAVAPESVTMNDFARELSHSLKKRRFFPNAPAFFIKLLLGEQSSMVLEGSRISSEKIKSDGFHFLYSNLKNSLK